MNIPNAQPQRLLACTVILVVVIGLGGLLTIPFFFESPSIYYKFGLDKIMLRSGKMVGLAAAFSLLLQLTLAGRLKWLDRLFSLPALYRVHRINAYCLGFMVMVHPVLVFAPDGILMIPLESRYWPEWAGAVLVLILAGQVAASQWRRPLFKTYQRWQTAHRILGAAAIGLVILHVVYVSETFERAGLPRTLVLTAAGLVAVNWLWIRTRPGWSRRSPFRLTSIQPAGENAYTLELEPEKRSLFRYLPGQFAFLSIESKTVSKELHPFTLSSSPSRPTKVQFTIRCCGDWTNRISTLQPGDRAAIQGPFGRFSHLLLARQRDIIFIAGGIGVTPFLSMLRYMADNKDQRSITLLWSNQTPAHLFGRTELETMAQELTAFKWVPIFSREKTTKGQFGRLDRAMLTMLLKDTRRSAAVFLCGPPQMIRQVSKTLQRIGFPSHRIHTELFSF